MIKIGIIGAGQMATHHLKSFVNHADRCRIVAVADPIDTAANKLAEVCGATAHSDYTQILPEVDAVIICSPNFLHPEQTIACAQAGKHVWCEKPMAITDADADSMVAAVEKAGVASFVGFSVRFDPTLQKMREVLESGELGDPISIWSRRLSNIPGGTSWRSKYVNSGGLMSELTAHEIDWIVNFAGDPISVYCRKASRQTDDPRANDHLWMTLAFGPEFTGTIEGSQMAPISDYYRGIIGTKASVFTTEWGRKVQLQKISERGSIDLDLPPAFDKHSHFLDVIEGKCASVADVKWGRKIVNISSRALDSAISGEVVRF